MSLRAAVRFGCVIQVLTILIFGALLLSSEMHRGSVHPVLELVPFPVAALLILVPYVSIALGQAGICLGCRIELERRGSTRAVRAADWSIAAARWGAVLWHIVAVLVLGWLDVVRSVTGDRILLDELIAAAPPLLMFVLGWWSLYPIDRLLRDAALVGALDQGKPIHAPLGRWGYILQNVRHQLLIVLVPIAGLAAWSEAATLLIGWLSHSSGRLADLLATPENRRTAHTIGQVLGVAIVFAFMPPIVRVLWDTAPLGPGPTRSRLLDLCARHGVRVRDLLVWRTRGVMLNGAVLGLFPRLRYVLLTDALLEYLPEEQVEAVMAHEVGHVRRWHVPWFAASLLASVGIPVAAADLVIARVSAASGITADSPIVIWWIAGQLVALGLCVGMGLALFGWISRRFEWQADAFAAQHLSGAGAVEVVIDEADSRGHDGERAGLISVPAADAMAGALRAVARLNHIPTRKFSWRHGTIQRRIDNLERLKGLPLGGLAIDRHANLIKLCVGAAILVLGTLVAIGQ